MSNNHWTPAEVKHLMTYLRPDEQTAMGVLVHFAELARSSPDSTWGPIDDLDDEDKPVNESMMTTAEFVADLEGRMAAYLRAAVLRKAGGRNS